MTKRNNSFSFLEEENPKKKVMVSDSSVAHPIQNSEFIFSNLDTKKEFFYRNDEEDCVYIGLNTENYILISGTLDLEVISGLMSLSCIYN